MTDELEDYLTLLEKINKEFMSLEKHLKNNKKTTCICGLREKLEKAIKKANKLYNQFCLDYDIKI